MHVWCWTSDAGDSSSVMASEVSYLDLEMAWMAMAMAHLVIAQTRAEYRAEGKRESWGAMFPIYIYGLKDGAEAGGGRCR